MTDNAPPTVDEMQGARPYNLLEDSAIALYVDGRQVSCLDTVVDAAGNDVRITFVTTRLALATGGEPRLELAWKGHRSGDTIEIRPPLKIGHGTRLAGIALLDSVVLPTRAGDEAMFSCKMVTDMYDWNDHDAARLHKAGEHAMIPASWIPEKKGSP